MNRAEKTLVVLLRAGAMLLLLALAPVFFPFAWMDAIHRWLGMGPLPQGPIVEYLTRSLSALYAMHAALLLYVSFDVRRNLGVIKCLAVLALVFGAGMLVLDAVIGMPLCWTVCEGPFVILVSAALLYLAGQIDPKQPSTLNP